MRKKYNHKYISFSGFKFYLESQDTSYGFRHLGTLKFVNIDGVTEGEVDSKCTYYNRTWESYDYQTLVHKLVEKYIKTYKKKDWNYQQIVSGIDSQELGQEEDFFGTVTKIAKLGELLTDTKEESNKWKKRMLSAGIPGLSFPEDWDTLSEEEKESRLNKVIEVSKENK